MKHIYTFLASSPTYGIEEEYIYVCEKRGGFWHYKSPDIDTIDIIGYSKVHCDRQCIAIIQSLWSQSNVFVSVKKIASSLVRENASK